MQDPAPDWEDWSPRKLRAYIRAWERQLPLIAAMRERVNAETIARAVQRLAPVTSPGS